MCKKLPVTYPILNSYPTIANNFTMLMSYNNYEEWIASSYLTLKKNIKDKNYTFYLEENLKGDPVMNESYDLKDMTGNEIVQLIVKNIDKQEYCRVYYDRYYVHKNKGHFLHSCFIYGYDANTFLCCDFVGTGGKYDFFQLPIQHFIESVDLYKTSLFAHYIPNLYKMMCFWVNDSRMKNMKLDLSYIVEMLKQNVNEDFCMYDEIQSHYNKYNMNQWLDWRPMAVIRDYVIAHEIRYKCLQKIEGMTNDKVNKNIQQMKAYINDCILLLLLHTKKKDAGYVKRIISSVGKIREIDAENTEIILENFGE